MGERVGGGRGEWPGGGGMAGWVKGWVGGGGWVGEGGMARWGRG